ncbi:sulfurtransferase TusA family protein, partial [Shewanella sp.]
MIIIDLTAYRCPYPLVQTKLKLKQLAVGDKMQLQLSDPGSRQDVPAYLKKTAYPFEIIDDNQQV